MNRNVLHSQKLNESDICKTTALIFSPGIFSGGIGSKLYMDLVLPILVNTDLDFVPFHPDVDWEQRAIDCVRRIKEIYAEGSPGAELMICAVLAQFWHLLINGSSARFHNTKTLSMRNRKRIKDMIAYIENHYEEPITLADIAAAANVSARECTRCFNTIIGETPIVYLMKHRISVAAEKLLDPDCTVTGAAVSSGFDNLSYFAKIFRRYMNVTPRAYQKQIKDGRGKIPLAF
jgi:AraC-like DNA-binding protein